MVIARMAHRVRRVSHRHRRTPQSRFPQLLVVRGCLHAVLHHWCICGYCVGYDPDLSRSYCWLPRLWTGVDEFNGQFYHLLLEWREGSDCSWSYLALDDQRKASLLT